MAFNRVTDPPRPVVYWIKCDRDLQPLRYAFDDPHDMFKQLTRKIAERGPIEFMVRES